LEEQVGGVGIVREVADLVDGQKGGTAVAAESMLEGAGRFLSREVEDQIGRGEEACGVPGENGLVDKILGQHRLAEPVRGDDDDVFTLREEIKGQGSTVGRWMCVGPCHSKSAIAL
jgi:hypothetical protein